MQLSKTRLWLSILVPFGLGFFITSIFRTLNAILAHPLMQNLHLNSMEIGWVTSMYALTFALTQIPLGIFLDFWGERKTQTFFFFIGSIGIIIFGLAVNVVMLVIGRALLGIGMAGGLMAAFKAISEWVDQEKIPFYNGIILAIGGIGALVATTPSKLFEIYFGWRALCITLGIITCLVALLILFVVRDKHSSKEKKLLIWEEIRPLKMIYSDRFFWRITPLFTLIVGGFIAMQGLWLGPWLQYVVGFTPLESANYLFVIAIAMTLGMISGGLFSYLSKRTKIPLIYIVVIGGAIHIASQVLIVINIFSHNFVIWFIYGYFAQVALVNYAIIAQHFGPQISGRAITAANILTFVFAFLIQYFFGLVLHLWPNSAGNPSIAAYQAAFGGLIVLECLAMLWFFLQKRRT